MRDPFLISAPVSSGASGSFEGSSFHAEGRPAKRLAVWDEHKITLQNSARPPPIFIPNKPHTSVPGGFF